MQSLRCLRSALTSSTSALFRHHTSASRLPTAQSIRTFSLLSPRRPQLLPPSASAPAITAGPIDASTPDLMPKISAHPSLLGTQVRCGPRDTLDPSHRVRKRRHGFLARNRKRTGRAILKRRRLKGRHALTH